MTARGLHAAAVAAMLAAGLAACGGSGGGSDSGSGTTVVGGATNDYQLRNSYVNYLNTGYTQKFNVSGTNNSCTGTETQVSDKPIRTTFGGQEALAILLSDKLELQNCPNLASGPQAVYQYFDTTYRAIGAAAVPTGSYGVYDQPVEYPARVQAGDSGVLGVERLYIDSTRAVYTGKAVLSYEVKADTADSLLILFTLRSFNGADVPTGAFQTSTYRLARNGSFSVLSIEVRDVNGQQVRLEPVSQ